MADRPADSTAEFPPAELAGISTLEGLARALRQLRRREARQRADSELTLRELAGKTGWSHAVIGEYLAGKTLPPTDRFDVLAQLLGASPTEQGALATARDRVEERRRGAAPASGGRTVPRQLPAAVSGFIGRGGQLATLQRLLAAGERAAALPVVAVSGMGGVGKTALAVQFAHRLTGRFPDGQLYVDLRGDGGGLAPLEVLGRFLRSLGVSADEVPAEVEEAAALLRSRLAERRVLLVLDNARDEAVALLRRLAGSRRVSGEPQAAREVARLCGYLPLALRIAGARLAAHPGWPLSALAERLADASGRLDELQAGELAVRTSFNFSLQALRHGAEPLDRAAAAAFGLLSLPDGPDLSVTAAARLLDQPESTTRRSLERLVDAQLLQTPRPGRYQFHDLVRLFARPDAAAHPEAERRAALTRLFGFYTASAWRTLALLRPSDRRLASAERRWTAGGLRFADAAGALEWLEAERANLLAAIGQAAQAAPALPAELPGQLTRALYGFFEVRGYWQDSAHANRTVLALARRDGDRATQAHACNDLGNTYRLLGRFEEAIASLRESLALFRELDDPRGQAASLNNLGAVNERLGRFETASRNLEDCLPLFRQLGDLQGEATCLNNLGVVGERMGRYHQAAASLRDSLAIYRELGDGPGQGSASMAWAWCTSDWAGTGGRSSASATAWPSDGRSATAGGRRSRCATWATPCCAPGSPTARARPGSTPWRSTRRCGRPRPARSASAWPLCPPTAGRGAESFSDPAGASP